MLLWKITLMAEKSTLPRGASEVKGVDGRLPILIYSMRRVCEYIPSVWTSTNLSFLSFVTGSHPIWD